MDRFFEVVISNGDRWHLELSAEEPPLDIWACRPIEPGRPIPLHVFQEGTRVDYERTSFAIPVVSRRFAEALCAVAPMDFQRIPAIVVEEAGEWEILNVLARPDCIDRERSAIQYYPRNHAEKPGRPRGVLQLVLDPTRVGGHSVFRPKDWEVALIVSQAAKSALDAIGATGLEFVPVTGR